MTSKLRFLPITQQEQPQHNYQDSAVNTTTILHAIYCTYAQRSHTHTHTHTHTQGEDHSIVLPFARSAAESIPCRSFSNFVAIHNDSSLDGPPFMPHTTIASVGSGLFAYDALVWVLSLSSSSSSSSWTRITTTLLPLFDVSDLVWSDLVCLRM